MIGDAREPGGSGLGHPFGLLLCSKLVDLTEKERLFASAFRYSKKFEEFWKVIDPSSLQSAPLPLTSAFLFLQVFPFPDQGLKNANLIEKIFFSDDPPIALFEDDGHKEPCLPNDQSTRAWLKQGLHNRKFLILL